MLGLQKAIGTNEYFDVDEHNTTLHDCAERDLIVYHLLRMVRDVYINSQNGGQAGAYRKQCRTKRKSALTAILSRSEETLTFRWSCKVLGFDPDTFRNRVLFDVRSITDLMRDGVRLCQDKPRKSITTADVWLWDEAPLRYQLSEKKGHYVVKMSKGEATDWMSSLENSPLEFSCEQFDLTSDDTILVLRHR